MFVTPTTSPARLKSGPPLLLGIDLRAGSQIKLALDLPRLGADDALNDCALQTERAADGENGIAHRQGVRAAERDGLERRRVLVLDVQQREVGEIY